MVRLEVVGVRERFLVRAVLGYLGGIMYVVDAVRDARVIAIDKDPMAYERAMELSQMDVYR